LTDDFTNTVSLKCKKNAGPVAVTIETEQGKDGGLTSKIGTKFAYAKFNVDKGQVKADGGRVLETSLVLSPDVKLSFKANKGADLGIDYIKGNFYATGVFDVVDMSKVSGSACMGLPKGIKVGGDATYALSGATGFSGFSVGASYTAGPIFTSLTATSKLSKFNIGLLYKVSPELSIASQTVHTADKVCDVLAIGGLYKAPIGTFKAKMGSNGILSACMIKEIAPKVTLTAAGTMTASDPSTFKPGLAISM
jgi:voltage-dependent anion channel protein 2